MPIIDANAILRYVLYDDAEMANKVDTLMSANKITVRYEVMAEVIYVLEKVYAMQRKEISDGLKIFLALPNAEVEMKNVLLSAIEIYAENNLDFVDCLLCGFKKICRCDIFTFDKKLTALLNEL